MGLPKLGRLHISLSGCVKAYLVLCLTLMMGEKVTTQTPRETPACRQLPFFLQLFKQTGPKSNYLDANQLQNNS